MKILFGILAVLAMIGCSGLGDHKGVDNTVNVIEIENPDTIVPDTALPDTVIHTIITPNDTIIYRHENKKDTIIIADTIISPNDTVVVQDTIYPERNDTIYEAPGVYDTEEFTPPLK